jgi:hypothetical protein
VAAGGRACQDERVAGDPAAVVPHAGRTRPLALGHAFRWVALVAVLKSALNLAFAGRYGWQIDELYYLVAGRHPSGGYVDYPPVTALLAHVAETIFGASLVGFRLFAVLAGAGVVFLAALVARELGGDGRAQIAAAVVVGFSPLLIATNGLFQPVSFDALLEMLLLYLALRLALRPSTRLWLLIGAVIGVGIETKYTMALLAGLVLAAFLAAGRTVLQLRGLLVAAAVAVLLMIPNLVWEARHGWISVHWFLHPGPSVSSETRPQFVLDLLLLSGLVTVPVALVGLRLLWRDRRARPLAVACLATLLAYFALNGKSYYAGPVVYFALAAGAVPLARWAPAHVRRLTALGTAWGVFLIAGLPIGVPLLPLRTAIDWGVVKARSDYQDELGWPELAADVRRAAAGQPVIVTANYGEAGALELYGHGQAPVDSGHMSFRYWAQRLDARRGVVVGYDGTMLARLCSSYSVVAHVRMPQGVDNEEKGAPIARCTFRGGSLRTVWPQSLYPRS